MAQNIIKGAIYNNGQGVASISVLAHAPKNKNNIIAFAITQSDGSFQFSLNTPLDSISVTAQSLNYSDTTVTVANRSQEIYLEVIPEIYELSEVLVKAAPILLKKDTIVYIVGAFAKKNDRSIGDIINQLPGFEVESNGAINYQGNKIEKYYIEGMDLMEGKYGIVNNNLSYKKVGTIEVLENHQPIKMLDSLVFSDKTSINIHLKKNVSTVGKVKLGTGLSPFVWDVGFTPMIFNKKQQAIASYQTNNIGEDVSEQLIQHYYDNMKDDAKEELLNLVTLVPPQIAKNRYLNNNIHLLTYNHILKINNNASFKINSSYINDSRLQEGGSQTNYLMADDTIRIRENIYNKLFTSRFHGEVIYNENSKNRFLKNKFSINKHWDHAWGIADNNGMQIHQHLKAPFSSVNNHFEWIMPAKKDFVTIKSKVSYGKTPERLIITPGAFNDILNDGFISSNTRQQATSENFTTQNQAGFTLNKKYWHFDSNFGFEFQKKKLNSNILTNEAMNEIQNFRNNLNWNFFSPFFSEVFRYETPDLVVNITIPVKYVAYTINDKSFNKKEVVNKLLIDPSIFLHYKISGYLGTNISVGFNNRLGNINDIHYGYLLTNYRTFSIKDTPLLHRKDYNYNYLLKYTNPIESWFVSLAINQVFSTKNILLSQTINSDGAMETNAFLKDNKSKNSNIYFKGSKLLYDLGSTIYLNSGYRSGKNKRYSNGLPDDVKNTYIFIEPRLSITKFGWMDVDYKFHYSEMNQNVGLRKFKFIQNNHLLNLNFFPVPKHSIRIDLEYYSGKSANHYSETRLANINYIWKPQNSKLTVELKCSNLFNDNKIVSYFNTDIANIENSYQIRPRQFILSFDFSL